MPETTNQRVACRVCGQPLDDGLQTCPTCARTRTRTRSALALTAGLALLLLAAALVLAAIETSWP